MLTRSFQQQPLPVANHVGSIGDHSACLSSPGRRLGYGERGRREQKAQCQKGSSTLEGDHGQSGQRADAGWLGGIGALLASTSTDLNAVVSHVIRAVGRGNHHRRASRPYEDQDCPSDRAQSVPTQVNEAGDFSRPVLGLDSVLGLSFQMEDCQGAGANNDTTQATTEGGDEGCRSKLSRQIRGGDPKLAHEIRNEYAAAMQRLTMQQQQEQQQMRAIHHQELGKMRMLRADLMQKSRDATVLEVMMNEYADMALGKRESSWRTEDTTRQRCMLGRRRWPKHREGPSKRCTCWRSCRNSVRS